MKKFNLSEEEINDVKKNLMIIVKRIANEEYYLSPERLQTLPEIVRLLLDNESTVFNFVAEKTD